MVGEKHQRPQVFISSTIVDFRDLRSALKYWLEELGFEVALSELTDFPRRPDQATFDSCFDAIDRSDYYVLLIGARPGSEFESGVSVTRAEFRRALDRAKEGKLKLALFVRSDVRSKLRERNAALSSVSDERSERSVVASTLDGPEEIQSFIDEVESAQPRDDQTSSGTTWLYQFASFRDIVDALRQMFQITGSVRKQVLLANLELEIEQNLARLCTNSRGIPSAQHELLANLRDEVELTPQNVQAHFTLSDEAAVPLGMFFLGGYSPTPLSRAALDDCLRSGEFLEYDALKGRMESGAFHRRLTELGEWLSTMASRARWVERYRDDMAAVLVQLRQHDSTIVVPGPLLLGVLALYDATENVLRLLVSLYRSVGHPDAEVHAVPLRPLTPIAGQEAGIKDERATVEHVRAWLDDPVVSSTYLHEQTQRQITEDDVQAACGRFPWLGEILDAARKKTMEEFLQGKREFMGFKWDAGEGFVKVDEATSEG